LSKRDGIAIDRSSDQLDEIQYALERDLAIGNFDRDSKLLRDVSGALRRIQEGSYGICMDCDEPISSRRLAASPWVRRCVKCQELAERTAYEAEDSWGGRLASVA
jgi:DnaK suppressor protein